MPLRHEKKWKITTNDSKQTMKYFVDANIFLRFFAPSEKEVAEESERVLQVIKDGKIKAYTSVLVLSEVVWVLGSSYKAKKDEVIQAVDAVNSMKNLKFTEDFNRMLALEIYSDNKVKFIDSLIASNKDIQVGNMKVLSYDKDFDKIGVDRVEPGDLFKNK